MTTSAASPQVGGITARPVGFGPLHRQEIEIDLPRDIFADAPNDLAHAAMLSLPRVLRTHSLRITLFLSTAVLADDEEMGGLAFRLVRTALRSYDEILQIMTGSEALADLHPEALASLRDAIAGLPDAARSFRTFSALAHEAVNQAKTAAEVGPDLLKPLLRYGFGDFSDQMTRTVDHTKTAYEAYRADAERRVRDAGAAANAARARIDEISRTVRLIALNAHVEAARAGDAGRGFGVIAKEIKMFSEETERASRAVETGIAAIMKSLLD